ncbi:MAG: hypothetical protein KDB01_02655 [Planctomycetaceae bacterium]|nr:hypothetical protein [Planctomycetaceae bacterium]
MARASSVAGRRTAARESFGNAAETIGPCVAGMSLFAITRGQWSMIDAVLHCLDQVGPSAVSLWTWTVAEYEVEVLTRLRVDNRVTAGRLIIDHGARNKNASIIAQWKSNFGADSVRYVVNHSKIATVESESGLRFLLRGSMNLNYNPRFEQFDITEGGPEFDLVREIELELPDLNDDCSGAEVYEASKMSNAFSPEQLTLFESPKTWKPNARRPK